MGSYDIDVLADLVIDFIQDSHALISEIELLITEQDLLGAARACHSLMLTSYAIGAMRLSDASRNLELALEEEEQAVISERTDELDKEFVSACNALMLDLAIQGGHKNTGR